MCLLLLLLSLLLLLLRQVVLIWVTILYYVDVIRQWNNVMNETNWWRRTENGRWRNSNGRRWCCHRGNYLWYHNVVHQHGIVRHKIDCQHRADHRANMTWIEKYQTHSTTGTNSVTDLSRISAYQFFLVFIVQLFTSSFCDRLRAGFTNDS